MADSSVSGTAVVKEAKCDAPAADQSILDEQEQSLMDKYNAQFVHRYTVQDAAYKKVLDEKVFPPQLFTYPFYPKNTNYQHHGRDHRGGGGRGGGRGRGAYHQNGRGGGRGGYGQNRY